MVNFILTIIKRPDEGKDIYDDSEERQREAQHYIDEIITPIVNKLEDKPRVDLQWFSIKISRTFFEGLIFYYSTVNFNLVSILDAIYLPQGVNNTINVKEK